MRRIVSSLVLVLALGLSFGIGYLSRGRGAGTEEAPRRVLYWVDPMNPAFRSDRPGIAPCGMPLEPVWSDDPSPANDGRIRVSAAKQQAIGVEIAVAERRPARHVVRLFGRVAVDESRIFRLATLSQGWIRASAEVTDGTVVAKNDPIAVYSGQEVVGPQQAFMYAVETVENLEKAGAAPEQVAQHRRNLESARRVLENLGLTDAQIEELVRTKQPGQSLLLRAPATGIVLERGSGTGAGEAMGGQYSVADLGRVWILADTFAGEADLFGPGAPARVRVPRTERSIEARVSRTPPRYDPVSRALQIRLEADNPELALLPGMSVDVELDVEREQAVVVPREALIDTGQSSHLFVEVEPGTFEPRDVSTGWRHADEVEIARGLEPGERFAVSGTFLLDSERRMRAARAPARAVPPG